MSGFTYGGQFDVALLPFPGAGQRERTGWLLSKVQSPDNEYVEAGSLDGRAGVGGA